MDKDIRICTRCHKEYDYLEGGTQKRCPACKEYMNKIQNRYYKRNVRIKKEIERIDSLVAGGIGDANKVEIERRLKAEERVARLGDKILEDKKPSYYQRNKEKVLMRTKLYHQKNKEKRNAYSRAYYAQNKEKFKAYWERAKTRKQNQEGGVSDERNG